MALAISIALKEYNTAPHALELEELKALAFYGLVDAASRWFDYCERKQFDPTATQFFTKYSSLRIRGAIRDRIRSNDWATRSLRDKSRKINAAMAEDEELTNFSSYEELAEASGLTEKEVRDTMTGMSRAPVPLYSGDMGLDDQSSQESSHEHQLVGDEDIESSIVVSHILNEFADAVRDLPFEERLIIALHYHQGLELKKAAALLGISDAMASTLHTTAVLSLLTHLQKIAG